MFPGELKHPETISGNILKEKYDLKN